MSAEVGKILVTGASGYIGRPLVERLGIERVVPLYNSTPIANGFKFDALTMKLRDVIVEAGEITHAIILHADSSPNACAEDVAKSDALNVASAISVIDDLIRLGIKPVFASSEAVFGQDKTGPYSESERPVPVFTYGRQKVDVEDYILANCAGHLIVRIARVIGSKAEDPTGFEEWIDAIERRGTIVCASDQIMSPVCLEDAVEGIARLIEANAAGVYHLPGERPILRSELLEMFIAEAERARPVQVTLKACSLHDFPVTEKRPLNSTMNSSKFTAETGYRLTAYDEICRRIAQRISA